MSVSKQMLMAIVVGSICSASAMADTVVLSEDFDVDHTANWTFRTANAGDTDGPGDASGDAAFFFFDYNTIGIPSAPHSTGGSTRGLKLEGNVGSPAAMAGVSVFPNGLHVPGNFTMTLDVWQNFNGPFPAGGNGSTQLTFAGYGGNGTRALTPIASPAWKSVLFGATDDGASAADYRCYLGNGGFTGTPPVLTVAAGATQPDAQVSPSSVAVYAAGAVAGSTNNTNAYYTGSTPPPAFGSQTAPAAQFCALFPTQQTGTTAAGTQAMSWHTWTIQRTGGILTWKIDGKLIATCDISMNPAFTFDGDNIFVAYSDFNGTVSTDPNRTSLLFGLVDNIVVTVPPGPVITVQPASQTICVSSPPPSVQFSVTATGPGLTYQWQKDSGSGFVNLTNSGHYSNVTTSTMTISPVDGTDLARYQVIITDSTTQIAISNPATLSNFAGPTLTKNTYNTVKNLGQTASFTVDATSNATPNTLSFQWYKGASGDTGTPLSNGALVSGTVVTITSGAGTSQLDLSNLQRADARALTADPATQGMYWCKVSDACTGFTNSAAGQVTMLPSPCNDPAQDLNGDGLADMNDFGRFQSCWAQSGASFDVIKCTCADSDNNQIIDGTDLTAFETVVDGPGGHPKSVTAGPSSLYTNNFEVDDTANWTANVSTGGLGTNHLANYFFDYGDTAPGGAGIPAAPSGAGTHGIQLKANVTGGLGGGLSVTPNSMNLTGNYILQYDLWINYTGPLNTGFAGTTQYTNGGIMTDGLAANVMASGAGATNGFMFSVVTDGDIAFNSASGSYLAATTGQPAGYPRTNTSVYAANVNGPNGAFNREPSHPFYSFLGAGQTAPAAQVTNFPGQTGTTFPNLLAFAWHTIKIVKTSYWVVWYVDNTPVAIVPIEAGAGGKIFFGQSDFNNTSIADSTLMFSVVDNVSVVKY